MLWYGASPCMGWTSTPGKAVSKAARDVSTGAITAHSRCARSRSAAADQVGHSRSTRPALRGCTFRTGAQNPSPSAVVVAQCGVQPCGLFDAPEHVRFGSGTCSTSCQNVIENPSAPNGFARHQWARRHHRMTPSAAIPPQPAPTAAVPSGYPGPASTTAAAPSVPAPRQEPAPVHDDGEHVVEHSRFVHPQPKFACPLSSRPPPPEPFVQRSRPGSAS